MDKIIRFLIDPIKEGVYQKNFEIRLESLQEFSYYLNRSLFNDKCEMLKWITNEGITSKSEFKILNLFDMLMKLSYEIKKEDEKYLRYITEIKREYINFQGMLFTIRADPFYSQDFSLNEKGLKEDYENLAQYSIINDNNYFLKYLYKSNYYNNLEDLIIIKIKVYPRNESIIIETYNLQESGSYIFTDHLRSIPILGQNINTFNTGIKHSINNVLELYPTCINLFTEIKTF